MKARYAIGRIVFWSGWPVFYLILKDSRRTRVLVAAKDKLLVIRGWHDGGLWSFPGGGIKPGEDAQKSAAREVFEETGVKVAAKDLSRVGSSHKGKDGISFTLERYCAELKRPAATNPQALEIGEVAWLPYKELGSDNASQETLEHIQSWLSRK